MTAQKLKQLAAEAERAEAANTLAGVCEVVGIGLRDVQSRDRSADVAKQRAVVAWVLHDRLKWSVKATASALRRTPRQVKALVARERN